VDDLGFISDMIAHFKDLYCIDTARIYAVGKSNGGAFAGHTLACDPALSKVIAAFASVSGAFYVPGSSKDDCNPETISIPCSPGRSLIPLVSFHGSADKTIPYYGGPRNSACLPAVTHWVEEWSKRQNFGVSYITSSLYDNRLMKYEYGSGDQTGSVTHYMSKDLGHWWPSVSPNHDNPAGSFYDATPIIMEFFNKHTLKI
jgi:poly(3-hydroxybutyrate) depolymerase